MTARIGAPKTGGRKRGSLDKSERQLVTSEMAGDIMTVYKRLGGVRWLLKFAQDNPAEFLRQGLSRLFPAAPKDEEIVLNQQFNFDTSNTMEVGRRIAFALASAVAAQRELAPVAEVVRPATVITPQEACRVPAEDVCLVHPLPEENPERDRWASELPLSDEERADQKLVRQTRDASIVNYCGSGAEQGYGAAQRPSPEQDPRAAQRDRMLRKKDLL